MSGAVFSLVGAIIMGKPTPAEAAKILKSWEPVVLAGEVLDHDINPDDHYQVEQFLRRKNPKISQRLIGACIVAARRKRDLDRLHGLFEYIRAVCKPWPAKPSASEIDNIAEGVSNELARLADKHGEHDAWHSQGTATELAAARYAAIYLLIEQAAWRAYVDELDASFKAWNEKEEAQPS
jgi:hypothetical protein